MFLWILCFLSFGWAMASDGQWLPELETNHATLQAMTSSRAVFTDNFLSSRSLEAIAKDPGTDGQMSGAVIAGIAVASWIGLVTCCWCATLAWLQLDGYVYNGDRPRYFAVARVFCFWLLCPLTLPVVCCYFYREECEMLQKSHAQASEDPDSSPESEDPDSSPELPKLLGAPSKAPSVPEPVAPPASKPASGPAPAAVPKVVLNSKIPAAQWPRGKVATFKLQRTGSFEAFGHQYTLDPQDRNLVIGKSKFRWPDGTVQTLDRKDRNTLWWRTNHPNPEWQRFQWVCSSVEK
eukprot:Skav205158  [mRNA]  locus=scaffold593:518088:519157:- [translate_table: standard]